jgi:hypothetical protein
VTLILNFAPRATAFASCRQARPCTSRPAKRNAPSADPKSAPLVAVKPFVDHGMRERLRLLAVPAHNFSGYFHVTGMNGHEPFIAFDSGADRIPYASIFHKMNIALKLEPEQ